MGFAIFAFLLLDPFAIGRVPFTFACKKLLAHRPFTIGAVLRAFVLAISRRAFALAMAFVRARQFA
jgi:hypothetical protein